MSIVEELYTQHNQHPLDVDIDMFYKAAIKIEELENALLSVVRGNSGWGMNMDEEDVDAVNRLIREIETV